MLCLQNIFSKLRELCYSFRDVTINGEDLQICAYHRYSWSLNYVRSFTYPSHCDTVKPFTKVIFVNPWHSNLLPCVWKWSCPYMYTCTWFNYIDLSRPGIEHRYPPGKAKALQLYHRYPPGKANALQRYRLNNFQTGSHEPCYLRNVHISFRNAHC